MLKTAIIVIASIISLVSLLAIASDAKNPRIIAEAKPPQDQITNSFYWQVATGNSRFVLACEDAVKSFIKPPYSEEASALATNVVLSLDDYFDAPVVASCRAEAERGTYTFDVSDITYQASYRDQTGIKKITESNLRSLDTGKISRTLQEGQSVEFFVPLQVEKSSCSLVPATIYYRDSPVEAVFAEYLGFGCE